MKGMNVDCGCIIFQFLPTPAAILLSRTSHFWYEISQRRPAYSPINFPSFQQEFDILEYRQWQEFGRQRTSLTPLQLIRFSTSRVWLSRLNDLELRFDSVPPCYCLTEPDRDQSACPAALLANLRAVDGNISVEEVKDVISRYRSIQAFTMTIRTRRVDASCPTPEPYTCYSYNQELDKRDSEIDDPSTLFDRTVLTQLLRRIAPALVSFQLCVPLDQKITHRSLNHTPIQVSWLRQLKPSSESLALNFPHLVHLVHSARKGSAYNELGPFLNQCRGVVEILQPFRTVHSYGPSNSDVPVNQFSSAINLSCHLLIRDPTYGPWSVTASTRIRSKDFLLPFQSQFLQPPRSSDTIPIGSNLLEVNLYLSDDQEQFDLLPLTRVAHSLLSLQLETENSDTITAYECDDIFQQLHKQLLQTGVTGDNHTRSKDELDTSVESSSSATPHPPRARHLNNSAFPHMRVLKLGSNNHDEVNSLNSSPIEIDCLSELFPSLHTLQLHGQISLPYQEVDSLSSLVQLRHLTTPIPHLLDDDERPDAANYIKRIILELRQLEQLHFLLPVAYQSSPNMEVFDTIIYSSTNLTQLTFSQESQLSSHWCLTDDDTSARDRLTEFLIRLHILWRCIQPTHTIPIESIILEPVCMTDFIPLLTTFLRHPSSQLPYLITACREFDVIHPALLMNAASEGNADEAHPPPPSLGDRIRRWLTRKKETRVRQVAKLAQQQHHEAIRAYLTEMSHQIEQHMAKERQPLDSTVLFSDRTGGDDQTEWTIHTRSQFRIILQLERE